MSEEKIQQLEKDIHTLFDFIISADARILGTQQALTRILMRNEETKEAFEAELEKSYQTTFDAAKLMMKENCPDIYSRVYGDTPRT